MFAAFAQFERDQLVERTHAGLARAKDQGKVLGRKDALIKHAEKHGMTLEAVQQEIRDKLAQGATGRGLAVEYGVSAPTILKLQDKAAA
jgi:putative DNA-invertase from lambdoid prophage Rac